MTVLPQPRLTPCIHGPDIISHCPLGIKANDVYQCELDYGYNGRVTLGGVCASCKDYQPLTEVT